MVEKFVRRQNIEHFRELLKRATDPKQRRMLEDLLREEEQKLKDLETDKGLDGG